MTNPEKGRLVVVSNRVGPLTDEGKAGGLAVGLADALKRRGGLWFGWSGETSPEGTHSPEKTEVFGGTALTTIDMTAEELDGFYHGYANRSLWPLLHYRLDLVQFDRQSDRIYRSVNQRFAARLAPLVNEHDLVWVHDYHFFYMGSELRQSGFKGRLGFFLHIPFAPPEILSALPAARDLVRSMLAYDLIGFQTAQDRRNFANFCVHELGGEKLPGDRIRVGGRVVQAAVFPIGIDAEGFSRFAVSPEAGEHEEMLRDLARGRLQIVGVDRLDYSKGLVERLLGFERLLEDYPENRGAVNFLQIAPLSRSELDAYIDLRAELEGLAGRLNGRFATLDWTPIQIMTTGFTRRALAGIYRAARVCMVTPLRDGMNLVAKEFVAAQDPDDPGVLILSRFAGARAELQDALIVNPYATDEMARALQRALTMPLDERQRRHEKMRAKVFGGTAAHWCESFIAALESAEIDAGWSEDLAAADPLAPA
ncbi:alpha,alpha-trehalose-phosphate synthase (UDP-forming) [Aureimonas sp. SA4125]|uniref:alpha,alpha-trehalose-phosphate synthase (UDP-forming) n=1 Tax=Aureimonas sp. SA4125 TaxID=2826993 RepID=UPI001CC74EC5|nr:trehalose-6-phosphate synthase [Aureimonas sp. SA4125]BDA86068.1 alpha,alpha-trehalose-phosphate synthase (UDP-forming) [Aureimonas sp. SA4125]